jgi:aminopeptidase YwaD
MPDTAKGISLGPADAAIAMTAEVIGRFGPRVSGSESNRSARARLLELLGEACPETRREGFALHPHSLFSIGKIFAVSYLVGAAASLLGGVPAAAAAFVLMILCVCYFVSQFILYGDAFDRLFRKVEGENLVGIVEPSARAERQVVLVGHHDSAPICPFYEKAAILYPIRLFAPIAFYLLCMVVLAMRIAEFASGGAAGTAAWTWYALVLGAVAVVPMYGFMSKRGSPGASDNLIGCGIALEVAKALRGKLRSTRLVILLADGEEVGQKGSRAFIKRYRQALRETPAAILNFDTIIDERDLTVLERDRNGLTSLSRAMSVGLMAAASGLGIDLALKPMPFLGGGTDAGQFALAGFEAASLIGIPMSAFRREIVFHTSKDVPDRISRAAVAAAIAIACDYVNRIDA